MRSRARGQAGQAVVETALVIPIFFLVVIGFVGLAIQVVARMQIDTALHLATVSALQAPLGDRADASDYAAYTFSQTVANDGSWLSASFAGCTGDYLSGIHHSVNTEIGGVASESSTADLRCSANDISINYGRLGVLGILWPRIVTIQPRSVTVYPSAFRSCEEGLACTAGS